MASKNLRIGITLGLYGEGESLWTNGIKQNAIYLLEALRHCPNVESVYLVNTTDVPVDGTLTWDRERWPVVTIDRAKDEVDVMIELGGQISADMTAHLKERGAHLVSYCCGSEYVYAMEAILFDRPLWGDSLFINQRFDAIWAIPQVAVTSGSYFQTLRRRPVTVVPFVWSPVLLEARIAELDGWTGYAPRQAPKRLAIMEPNMNVVKFCLNPILIAEEAYRTDPAAIERLYVTNAEAIAKNNRDFIALMHYLDLVKDGKATFVARFETPAFLRDYADVVISHQWGNPLNYHYFDVCWLGYPLIHNAQMIPELGYYYEGSDVTTGAQMLRQALVGHDAQYVDYRERQRRNLARFFPDARDTVEAYTALLDDLRATAPI